LIQSEKCGCAVAAFASNVAAFGSLIISAATAISANNHDLSLSVALLNPQLFTNGTIATELGKEPATHRRSGDDESHCLNRLVCAG